jgi:periplasmic protein CpxP/Spy
MGSSRTFEGEDMKKLTIIGVGAVAALTALGALAAQAGVFEQGHEKKAYRFISMRVDNMLDDIQANDSQRQQIHQLKDDLFNEGKALKGNMEGARDELKTQWAAPKADSTRVHQIVDQQLDTARAFAHKMADAALKLHDLLSPEQRAQLAKMHEERARSRW